jgi:hypothetical protein
MAKTVTLWPSRKCERVFDYAEVITWSCGFIWWPENTDLSQAGAGQACIAWQGFCSGAEGCRGREGQECAPEGWAVDENDWWADWWSFYQAGALIGAGVSALVLQLGDSGIDGGCCSGFNRGLCGFGNLRCGASCSLTPP